MPQPRKWRDQAERQRAYRRRKKMQGKPLDARGVPLDAEHGKVSLPDEDLTERIQKAGEDAIELFFRR